MSLRICLKPGISWHRDLKFFLCYTVLLLLLLQPGQPSLFSEQPLLVVFNLPADVRLVDFQFLFGSNVSCRDSLPQIPHVALLLLNLGPVGRLSSPQRLVVIVTQLSQHSPFLPKQRAETQPGGGDISIQVQPFQRATANNSLSDLPSLPKDSSLCWVVESELLCFPQGYDCSLGQTAGGSDLPAIDRAAGPPGRPQNDYPTGTGDSAVVSLDPLTL